MYCAVGVSVTMAWIRCAASAAVASLSVSNTLGWAVGWILPVMKVRPVVPT